VIHPGLTGTHPRARASGGAAGDNDQRKNDQAKDVEVRNMRVRVDVTRCMANGICEGIAEDVFDLGMTNEVVRVAMDPIPEDRRAEMEEAVAQCPVEALSIHED
jgi:ferredoxin